ncbi:MAG TPA: hypothetical protein VK645_04680 [Chitinophagaceae bacterium]|nr:hypothetical protein [Chitinophagaceae bacterium]
MKNFLFAIPAAAVFFILPFVTRITHINPEQAGRSAAAEVIGCGVPPAYDIRVAADGKFIPLLPGLGHYSYKVSSTSDSTQIYFNQGLNFYFSYHFREARASFKEATRFDKNSAMAWWGQALSMGPYFNTYYYKMDKEVQPVLQTMIACTGMTAKEKALVHAMEQRYSADNTNGDRPLLDSQYAAAMKELTVRYPDDNAIKALYIDAVMLGHKWDFWYPDGQPKSWTPELLVKCKEILKTAPDHPAALHYYIHLTEASRQPGLALNAAEQLLKQMPGAGHMVHMATHMYQRNGLYARGVTVNEAANTVNNQVDAAAPNLGIGQDKLIHVYAVQSFCALNAGMYDRAIPLYTRARDRVAALTPAIRQDAGAQEIFMLPVIAMVRAGKWQGITASPAPDSTWVFACLLDNFSKGMAAVRNKETVIAGRYLLRIQAHLQDSILQPRTMPFNAPVQCGRIAAGILQASIYGAEQQYGKAQQSFMQALNEEDQLIYREPQEWKLPVRQYLGALLLQTKRPAAAEKIYREDLERNPGNGWSLIGLYQSLLAQHKSSAAKYKTLYRAAFQDADNMPGSSVF